MAIALREHLSKAVHQRNIELHPVKIPLKELTESLLATLGVAPHRQKFIFRGITKYKIMAWMNAVLKLLLNFAVHFTRASITIFLYRSRKYYIYRNYKNIGAVPSFGTPKHYLCPSALHPTEN